jgi:hypothetical protein
MVAVLRLMHAIMLHAVNPGPAAVVRFQGRRELQTGNIIPFCNSQHKNSRAKLNSRASFRGFANGAQPGPPDRGRIKPKNTG